MINTTTTINQSWIRIRSVPVWFAALGELCDAAPSSPNADTTSDIKIVEPYLAIVAIRTVLKLNLELSNRTGSDKSETNRSRTKLGRLTIIQKELDKLTICDGLSPEFLDPDITFSLQILILVEKCTSLEQDRQLRSKSLSFGAYGERFLV